ncbi:2-dehydro-3-deoxygalactonokinase [Pseudoprimorskyibacter insulae]|uniref:Putative 2-dehydro-3-deoxygalactonokinase DgoK1 n=1 Tax=Pseudoprimorskyibacter insulae TaxID=1695997 RepID=A0A2R8AZW8_9RHOB|nr:2-dehydro-3-deoxygalactonokinase [Pseudoprimorskyibacter insulae]SPF81568.1 putative 2-dehydro-3-deoxygalactonokinase DgoK1 [Pseudoprimorskyibacter insulae]
MQKADWIAVDWGTSHMRAWAMDAQDKVIAERHSDRGMGQITPDQYPGVLADLMGELLPDGPVQAIICGMAGARQGWVEAPYTAVPCNPPSAATAVQVQAGQIAAFILPGVSQASPPDVMRGEETQIAGFMAANSKFDGVICLPGTHTKWVHVSAGEIVSFQTFMSGEIFALLSGQSVLRHSVAGDGWSDEAFAEAVADAMARPGTLAAKLFSIRADGLLNGTGADVARARLSGLLIGLELAGARPYWLGQDIALVGAAPLCRLYQSALSAQGAPARIADVTEMTLAGLIAAHATLKDPQ